MKLGEIKALLKPNMTAFGASNGIPKPSLSNFLNAKHMLADEHVLKLSEIIGVPVAELRKSFETEKAAKELWRRPLSLREEMDQQTACPLAEWIVGKWNPEQAKEWKLRAIEDGHDDFPSIINRLMLRTDSRNRT